MAENWRKEVERYVCLFLYQKIHIYGWSVYKLISQKDKTWRYVRPFPMHVAVDGIKSKGLQINLKTWNSYYSNADIKSEVASDWVQPKILHFLPQQAWKISREESHPIRALWTHLPTPRSCCAWEAGQHPALVTEGSGPCWAKVRRLHRCLCPNSCADCAWGLLKSLPLFSL